MAALTTPLLEDYIPVVKYSAVNTNQNVTIGGSANFDASGSTGTFKTTTGVTTVGGALTVTGVATFTAAPVMTLAPTGPQVRAVALSALAGATVVLTAADSGKVLI